MTVRQRAAAFLERFTLALTPLLEDHTARVSLSLSASEARVVFLALSKFTAAGDDWQPIKTLPDDRPWGIRDDDLSEDVTLARALDDGAPLFFLLQEKDESGIREHTMWCPAVRQPNPPRSEPTEVVSLQRRSAPLRWRA